MSKFGQRYELRKFLPPTLLADDKPVERPTTAVGEVAHGFYWTEGFTGLGWAVDAVPTLKNGSTIGIPSPPAILLPDGRLIKPSLEDAERLQGFEPGWTEPAESVVKKSARWSLVGSAVSVPVAEWVGRRLSSPGVYNSVRDREFLGSNKAPRAARFDGLNRYSVAISTDPVGTRPPPLAEFLTGQGDPLSLRAAVGFLSRTRRAKLRFDSRFILAVEQHIVDLGGQLPPYAAELGLRKAA